MKEYTIWQNYDLNLDDYKDAILECNPDIEEDDEDAIYECMIDWNNCYLEDEMANCDIDTEDIICFANLGLWDGRHSAYNDNVGHNVSDCFKLVFRGDCDYARFYVDSLGDFRAKGSHHDGTNTYLFRAWRNNISLEQRENFIDRLRYGKPVTRRDINRYTIRLGDKIAKVYGWKVRKAS